MLLSQLSYCLLGQTSWLGEDLGGFGEGGGGWVLSLLMRWGWAGEGGYILNCRRDCMAAPQAPGVLDQSTHCLSGLLKVN